MTRPWWVEEVTVKRGAAKVGDRVRLVATQDDWTALTPGEEGTVEYVDQIGTIHVKWDSGGCLGLLPEIDVWEVIGS